MSELEKYIMNNRSEFDNDMPDPGHLERFHKKLSGQSPVRRINFRHALQIAASVAIIIASGWIIIDKSTSGDKVARSESSVVTFEAEDYFIHQVSTKYEQIEEFSFDSEHEKAILLNELKEMDIYHQKLMDDLKANPSDERVINAMISHYKMKLEIMDQIINQLNQIKYQTSENHEKESI